VDARRRIPASGIVYLADQILTADHVVERDEDISVLLADGTRVAASLAGRDPGSDLALLRLAEARATPAEKTTTEGRVGEIVIALGRPSPGGIEASLGIVCAGNSLQLADLFGGVDGGADDQRHGEDPPDFLVPVCVHRHRLRA